MGKGKKKFIEKNEGQHFHLLHRSQRDGANASEILPSEFVLVASKQTDNTRSDNPLAEFKRMKKKDHINSLGFKNDGYDYSQHLKIVEGGKYMSKTGVLVERIIPDLPDDAFASEAELTRDFQAITISEEYMDDDIRGALFNDEDEEGKFEELDDDFVIQAMQEPETLAFDFDAHIAKLIELSERSLIGDGKTAAIARGWDDPNLKGNFLRRKNKIRVGNRKGYEEEYDDDNDDDESFDESEMIMKGATLRHGVNEHEDNDDEDFDKFLKEYDDHQIGYFSEDIELEGTIDLNNKNDELLKSALDEFQQEEKDAELYGGIDYNKFITMKRKIALYRSQVGLESADQLTDLTQLPSYKEEIKADEEVDIKAEYLEQLRIQEEMAQLYPEYAGKPRLALTQFQESSINSKPKDDDYGDGDECLDEMMRSQEYMRQMPKREREDCTSASARSIYENRPAIIARDAASSATRRTSHVSSRIRSQSPAVSGSAAVRFDLKSQMDRLGVFPGDDLSEDTPPDPTGREGPDAVKSDTESEESEYSSGGRRRTESKAEKSLRKQQVRRERREKRSAKKALRNAFKSETARTSKLSSVPENTAVYRYSS